MILTRCRGLNFHEGNHIFLYKYTYRQSKCPRIDWPSKIVTFKRFPEQKRLKKFLILTKFKCFRLFYLDGLSTNLTTNLTVAIAFYCFTKTKAIKCSQTSKLLTIKNTNQKIHCVRIGILLFLNLLGLPFQICSAISWHTLSPILYVEPVKTRDSQRNYK